jgi:hypothetical protein
MHTIYIYIYIYRKCGAIEPMNLILCKKWWREFIFTNWPPLPSAKESPVTILQKAELASVSVWSL